MNPILLALIAAGRIAGPLAAKAKNIKVPDNTMRKLVKWKDLDETGKIFYTGALGVPAATIGAGAPALMGLSELVDSLNTGQQSVPEGGPMRFAGRKSTHYPRFRYDRSGRSSWKGGY